jgi:hypothetical protein
MESVYIACVMDDISAAHVDTVMKISKPRCAKVCAERRFLLRDRNPICNGSPTARFTSRAHVRRFGHVQRWLAAAPGSDISDVPFMLHDLAP